MNSERWQRVQVLFDSALSQADEKRNAFIESACGDDLELRDEVISLLALHEESDGIEGLEPTAWLGALAGFKRRSFAVDEKIGGRYRIRRRIGRGGMGDVYEAWDEELSIPVALKTLHLVSDTEEAHKRLKLEGLLARSVWHPNVCRVYDLDAHRDDLGRTWFLTMELLRGETLAERLGNCGRLPIDSALRLAEHMAAGLGAAHRAGVVHRDFKPGNVMLVGTGDEQALVTDFGVARAVSLRSTEDQGEESSRIIGTPAYMAPEQVRGEEVGPEADIYALGVVLYEMVTGTLPFTGESPMEVARRRLLEAAPSPRIVMPDLDERWEAVILRCLEREPRRRFGRIEEVSDALVGRAFGENEIQTLELAGRGWHTLPMERDAFVGREAELEELAATLLGGTRLVTLVGAGGMGKTRLAVRYAWRNIRKWPGGVWFCDLTEARDVNAIASGVSRSLGLQLGREDPVEQLGHAIAGRGRCLVIFDNFEQVAVHAATTVGRWLERAGEARFLVTSRERLNLGPEECVQTVEPLPAETGMEMFVTRVRWLRPGLELLGSEAESAREIVRLVDGMPLAIELAAARMRVMSAAEIVAQMRKRFQLLTGGRSARHETLAVTIDSSWELLSPWEQSAWAQCAVFEGGFTLEAAEGVLDLGAWPEAPWVVDVVQSLVDKCVLRMWVPEPGVRGERPAARFGMYVSLQEYARERLGEMGVEAEQGAEERHGRWYARYGTDEALEALERHGGIARRQELERELDNLVSACRRAVTRGDGATAGAAYGAGAAVLTLRGPLAKAVDLGRLVLETELDREARARALRWFGIAELGAGRMEEARDHYEAALAIHHEVGDRRSAGVVLGELSSLHRILGRMEEARAHFEAALAIHRGLGDRRFEGNVLGNLGNLHHREGRMEEARAHLEAALAIHRQVGNRRTEGIVLGNLGNLHREQGRMEEARTHFEAALAIHRELGNRRSEGSVLGHLGILHGDQGRMEEAHAHLEAALAIHREVGNRRSEGIVLGNLGNLHREQGRMEEARAHFQAALAIHREVGYRRFEGFVLGNLGILHRDQGRMEEARADFEAALTIHRELGDRRYEGMVLANLGDLHRRQGRIEESRDALERAEAMLRELSDPIELAKVLCSRAELEQGTGNVAAARAALHEAQQLAERAGTGPESELGRLLANVQQAIPPIP